jgi:PAS domain S-box-containing protein
MNDTPVLAEWIVEHISDAVIFADRSETIARWNRGAEALFGYSANEALGRKLDLIIPGKFQARYCDRRQAFCSLGSKHLPDLITPKAT